MIFKELFFKYNLNYLELIDLTLENNDEFIKVIPEIVFYIKGVWKNNIRKDFIKINITDIPYDLRTIIDMIRDDKGLIGIKIKIKKETFENKVIIKTKFKLNGVIGSIINNAIKIRANLIISNTTEIKVNYEIKSMLFDSLNDKINIHIQNKLENYYIKNIDKYFISKSNG
jgi:hypothetical protein